MNASAMSPVMAPVIAPDRPLIIGSAAGPMLGLLSAPSPATPPQDIGVLFAAGGAQYRIGAHRQFRELAHRLAGAGYPALRVDLPGQGDSPGEPLPYTAVGPCLHAAGAALLHAMPACRRIAVFGLCDGASAALLHAHHAGEPTWAGLAMLNPWLEPDAQVKQARERHYYRQRLFSHSLWRQLLSGGLGMASVRAALRSALGLRPGASSPVQGATAQQPIDVNVALGQAWNGWQGHLLLIVGGADLTGQAFDHRVQHHPDWRGRRAAPLWQRVLLPGADHTLSRPEWRDDAQEAMLAWLAQLPPAPGHP
jgi:exosortase A-associated hydrolase 1